MRLRARARTILTVSCCVALANLFSSCASPDSSRSARAVPVATPRFLELQEERSIATFHFPRGLYSLETQTPAGDYYRAPQHVMTHSFAGFAQYDGGIFVGRSRQVRIRAYIVRAGGVTQIGDLSRARYSFRN